MIKRIAVLVLLALAAGLIAGCASRGQTVGRTLPREDTGLVFSLTTFDGKTESKPFVTCLGHAWCSLDNRSGHSVYLGEYEVKDGEILAFSAWALSDRRGVIFNLEPEFIRQYGRYVGRTSLSMDISEEQLSVIADYIEQNDTWEFDKNCSYWSLHLWNTLADDAYDLSVPILCTPERLQDAMRTFDGTVTDMDFSRASGVFFLRDGQKTEVELCS